MAIVINGSGTVTGISVGGLPDGIVDSGTLATNSVDSAELIDGSIDTAHIAADQITGAILPAGTILQVQKSTIRTTQDTTSSATPAEVHSDYRVTITPRDTSSTILVMFFGDFYMAAENKMGLAMYRSVDGAAYAKVSPGDTGETFRNRGAGGDVEQISSTVMHYDSPATTDVCIYTPYFYRPDGTAAVRINDNGMGSFVVAMEVAG